MYCIIIYLEVVASVAWVVFHCPGLVSVFGWDFASLHSREIYRIGFAPAGT